MRLLQCATPVKAKTSAPPLRNASACAALTWCGLVFSTRTGSRERGRGLRQTLDRQQDSKGDYAQLGEEEIREPDGATPLEQGR